MKNRMDVFRTFYTEHGERLFGYLLRKSGNPALAADLAQETFTRYLERQGDGELSVALLFTMARNLYYDHLRRQRPFVELDEATLPADETSAQERRYIVREDSRQVLTAMRQLDEEDRDILALIVSGGLTYAQIAAVRGCSEATIKVRVHRARQKLRQILPAEPS